MAFIDGHRDRETDGLRWGVEPICRVLQVAPSTYYAGKSRPPSRRAVEDAALKARIRTVYQEQFGVYGGEKVCGSWAGRGSRWAGTGWPG